VPSRPCLLEREREESHMVSSYAVLRNKGGAADVDVTHG